MVMTDEYDDMSIMVTSEGINIMIMMAIKEIVMTNIQGEIVMMIKRMKMVMMGVVVVEYDNEKVANSG